MVSLVGCTNYDPPQFRLNLQGREPQQAGILEKHFGTPDRPIVPPDSQLLEIGVQKGPGSVRNWDPAGIATEHEPEYPE